MRTVVVTGGLFVGGALVAACGGGESAPTQAPAASGAPVTLEIGSKGDALEYDKTSFEVPAGSKVTLNFKNNASPGSGVYHNWVLVRPGTIDAVAADGIAAGEANDYLKPNDNRVIAHTKLAKEGETVSVTFDAPAPGTYDFLCTFPGHATLMRGKFIVK
ncbi:plastocyanin/azurin family copper-binding protein [Candidatus Roseilinea sp. NK_OTU-006]|uniref:plastocyanin/azurin family copper-binding protein n=1 Tax=Candidatus Roseilinea sp. NK_OTU-006 TaxID=2704250 RepID=UPI001F0B390E|nr:plastocyanin/azurin family copper-binding protein [Candidatus Roseilinea sp. NK_OTU-006]